MAARLAPQLEGMRAQAAEGARAVLVVEAALERAGLATAPRPTGFDDYRRWSSAANRAVAARLDGRSQAAAAHLSGGTLGALFAAVGFGLVALGHVEAAPGRSELEAELPARSAGFGEAAGRLRALVAHPAMPAATRDALTRVVEAARRVPRLEGPSPGAASSGAASLGHARMPARMAAWKRLLDALPPLVQQAAAGFAPLALS